MPRPVLKKRILIITISVFGMLSKFAKSSSFTRWMTPDSMIPSIDLSESAPEAGLRKMRRVQGSFTWVAPEVRSEYRLRWVSPQALKDLGLPHSISDDPEFAAVLSGSEVIKKPSQGLYPWAMNYAGYQFGNWAGQLGDGRAFTLFNINGEDVQLKGAGLTPYSRFADGKAILQASVREALVSEYLNAIGIPTTRALALLELPGTEARRSRYEPTAIVARFAPSWVRFGTFDLYHSRLETKDLRQLADYCIAEHFKDLPPATQDKNRYYYLWRAACLANARMIAKCQAYGFLNGVLNTDNISILGLSMDYGPFAFMETFNPNFTPNHDDITGRYGFDSVPKVMWWNSVRLGEAFGELIGQGENVDSIEFKTAATTPEEDRPKVANRAVDLINNLSSEFRETYDAEYKQIMCSRLGLPRVDEDLLTLALDTMAVCEVDYNHFLRRLGKFRLFSDHKDSVDVLLSSETPAVGTDVAVEKMRGFVGKYEAALEASGITDDLSRQRQMDSVNPAFVPENWIFQDVIEQIEKGDWTKFYTVADLILHPFDEPGAQAQYAAYFEESPKFRRGNLCSCSS